MGQRNFETVCSEWVGMAEAASADGNAAHR